MNSPKRSNYTSEHAIDHALKHLGKLPQESDPCFCALLGQGSLTHIPSCPYNKDKIPNSNNSWQDQQELCGMVRKCFDHLDKTLAAIRKDNAQGEATSSSQDFSTGSDGNTAKKLTRPRALKAVMERCVASVSVKFRPMASEWYVCCECGFCTLNKKLILNHSKLIHKN